MADAAPALLAGAADRITSLETVAMAPTPMFNKANATTITVKLLPRLATSKNAPAVKASRMGIRTLTETRWATGTIRIPPQLP